MESETYTETTTRCLKLNRKMLTSVLFVLSYGNYGFEVVYADCSEPTCYSRFDYEMRLFETIADTKQGQKTLTNTVDNLQDMVEKLEATVATQDTMANLLKAKVDAQEQLIQDQAVAISKYHESFQDIGYAGGPFYQQTGSGADYQCLPENPTWGVHEDGVQGDKAYIYGAEYEPNSLHFDSLAQQDVPCAVCLTTRSTSIMIPARTSCYPGWTFEYEGNLISDHYRHSRTQYICVDKEAESAPGTDKTSHNGALFYGAEGRCGSLPCPPYVEGRELACVVCSK